MTCPAAFSVFVQGWARAWTFVYFNKGIRDALSTLLSVPIFGFELSPIFAVGVACTITASILYSWAPERPARCARGAPPAYALVPARGEEGGEVDTKR